jgi:hypothetical protein
MKLIVLNMYSNVKSLLLFLCKKLIPDYNDLGVFRDDEGCISTVGREFKVEEYQDKRISESVAVTMIFNVFQCQMPPLLPV